jgi:acetone carboxylase gamma subunit
MLEIRDGGKGEAVCCTGCGHSLAPAGQPWKTAAVLAEAPMQGAAGPAYTTGEQVLLRRFFCPGCGALLDTETAQKGDPFLDDLVFG